MADGIGGAFSGVGRGDGRRDRPMASNRSSQRSRRTSSANRTRSVLSPARVPSCSWSVDSSMAWAITLAVPGVPVSTRISPLRPTVTGMSPRIRGAAARPTPAVPAGRDGLRRDVDVPVGARRLEQPELGDVARDGGLGDGEALLGERVDELALAADRPRHHELADGPLAEPLEIGHGGHRPVIAVRRRRRRRSGPR